MSPHRGLKLVADATDINDISNDLIELENWEDLHGNLDAGKSKCEVMHLKIWKTLFRVSFKLCCVRNSGVY